MGVLRVVREIVSLPLQLRDGGFELGNGGTDVGEFYDVGLGLSGQGSEFCQGIPGLLLLREEVREIGENAASQGDITGLYVDSRRFRKPLDDWKL